MKRKQNRISQIEFFKACSWITTNAERLLKERPSEFNLAKEISEALGFTMPIGATSNCKEATGVKWDAGKFSGSNPNSVRRRLYESIHQLQSEVDILRSDVRRLMVELNGPKAVAVADKVDWIKVGEVATNGQP